MRSKKICVFRFAVSSAFSVAFLNVFIAQDEALTDYTLLEQVLKESGGR